MEEMNYQGLEYCHLWTVSIGIMELWSLRYFTRPNLSKGQYTKTALP